MNFCVVGAGAWGTAFAVHLARLKRPTVLVPRRAEQAAALARARENQEYLPGVKLPELVQVSPEMPRGASAPDVVLLACPAQEMRPTVQRVALAFCGGAAEPFVISLAKGLESGTHLRPSQIIEDLMPGACSGALSGPTNAGEVARGLPAAMVLAAERHGAALEGAQAAMSGPTLRLYTSDDVAGVEYGGCLKNIYAIAAGCSDGLGLGDNTKAALLTRALAEMVRVGVALGARQETFYGLSGFGDLVATCNGGWSRNREFGLKIASGETPAALLADRRTVVEGYRTTESFAELCREKGIEAPILQEMHAILFQEKKPAAALAALMTRDLKRE